MTEDFDGCHRACRVKAAHSLIWGGCEHAIPPEPTVSMSMVYTDSEDGYPSIGFDAYTVAELGELITAGLRASDLPVNGDDLVDVGLVAAHAIIHRNDKPKERQSVTDQPTAEVQLAAARATNRRLNLRAQKLESELATYRRAISTWEFTERGTYVPLRSITAMAKAAGVGYDATRYELHYERVERDEAQLTAIADLIADHEGDEWAAHPATAALRRILDGQAPAASCSPATPETEPNNSRTTPDNPPTSSDWTPPPPGDRREQLPDHLLALLDIPTYTSTACETAELLAAAITRHPEHADELRQWEQRQRQRCRINNKYTGVNCQHLEAEDAIPPA